MLNSDNSLSNLRSADTKGCLGGSLSSLAVTGPTVIDGVGVWNPSDHGIQRRELLLVDESQLVGYLLGLAKVR